MADLHRLDELLRARDGDAGCTAGEEILDAYVELDSPGKTQPVFIPERRSIFRAAPAAGTITMGCSKRPAGLPTPSPSSRAGHGAAIAGV
jgi:hypothetical protein